MPIISRFYGLIIRMYYNDHAPPHFHAEYGEDEAVFAISPVELLAGYLPGRARALVEEWATLHVSELMDDWNRCRTGRLPQAIPPLD